MLVALTSTLVAQTDSLADTPVDTLEHIQLQISPNAPEFPVDYSADDSILFDNDNQKIFLFGKAAVKYSDIDLTADHIVIDLQSNTLTALGRYDSVGAKTDLPHFKDQGDEFTADTMKYNFTTRKGIIYGAVTRQGEGIIHGDQIKKVREDSLDIIYAKNGKYTTCDAENPHFHFQISKLKIIPNDKIVAGFSYLKVADIPTPVGIPFAFFPTTQKKRNGILLPSPSNYTNLQGFGLQNLGLFWSFNDHVATQLSSNIFSNGGFEIRSETKYIKRDRFTSNLKLSFLNAVQGDRNLKEVPGEYNRTFNYSIGWNHTQSANARPNSNFGANISFQSPSYNSNSTNFQNQLRSTSQSSINYRYSFPGTRSKLNVNMSSGQSFPNDTIPQVSFTGPNVQFETGNMTPLKSVITWKGMDWLKNMQIRPSVRFTSSMPSRNMYYTDPNDPDRQVGIFDTLTFRDFRKGIVHNPNITFGNFQIRKTFLKNFNIQPRFSAQQLFYFQKTEKWLVTGDRVFERVTPGFHHVWKHSLGMSANTTLYGMFKFPEKSNVVAIRHTLKPNVSMDFSPDFGEEKWGYWETLYNDEGEKVETYSYFENDFQSPPRAGKSRTLSMNLRNSFSVKYKDKSDSTGKATKKFDFLPNLSLNSSYNFLADSFQLAPITANTTINLSKTFKLVFNSRFDAYAVNDENTRIKDWHFDKTGKLVRLTNISTTGSYRLSGGTKDQKEKSNEVSMFSPYFLDYSLPWTLQMTYTINYTPYANTDRKLNTTLNFSGNVNLTEKWGISYRSGWDFERNKLSETSLTFNRDLHCWKLYFQWRPFGRFQGYVLTLSPKAGMLRSAEQTRRRDFQSY